MRWFVLVALVLLTAAAFGCDGEENGPSVAGPTGKATATATARQLPTGTPRPSPFATASTGLTPTLFPTPEQTVGSQNTAAATASASATLGPPTATPYPYPSPFVTVTPAPTPTPLPDPRRTVVGTGAPAGCFPSSPNPSEASLDLGEPTRYARGIFSIGLEGSGLTLLADRGAAVISGAAWNSLYQTYSVTPDGAVMAFMGADQMPGAELYLAAPPGSQPRLLATFDRMPWSLAIAPEGDRVALSGDDEMGKALLHLVDAQDGSVTPVPVDLRWISGQPVWSPDGDWLAMAAQEVIDGPLAIYVLRPDGSDLRRLATGGPPLAWSPDGSRIAFAIDRWEEGAGLYTADLEGPVTKISDSDAPRSGIPSLAWSPDGRCLAFTTMGPQWEDPPSLRVLEAETGWEVFLASDARHPAWSPDGSHIAFLRDGNLWVMNTDGSQQTRVTNPRQPFVQEPAWRPDGLGLWFSYVPPMAESVYLINPDGTDEVNLADGYGPVWSPDGGRIAFYGGGIFGGLGGLIDIYVMDSDGRGPVKVADVAYGDVVSPCFGSSGVTWSSDGRFLAYGGNVKGTEVAVSDGSAPVRQIGGRSGASWAPSGHRFVYSSCTPQSGGGPPYNVTIFDLDGGQTNILTEGDWPSWAPDGQRIAFYADDAVHLINVDGTAERTLYTLGPDDVDWRGKVDLVWSPNGSRLAIRTDGLFLVDIASGEKRKLAEHVSYSPPTWSPDGTQLAFSAWDDPNDPDTSQVYIAYADGTGEPRQVTVGSQPSWSPDGSRIAFAR